MSEEILKERKLTQILIGIAAFLVAFPPIYIYLGEPSWQLTQIFRLGQEATLPTWFSSMLWAFSAVSAYACARKALLRKEFYIWIVLACGFLLFSIDEVAMFHERAGHSMYTHFFKDVDVIAPYLGSSSWSILLSPLVIIFLVASVFLSMRLLRDFPRPRKFLLLGLLLVVFGGWFLEAMTNFMSRSATPQWIWDAEVVLEEGLEMFGAISILHGLRLYSGLLVEKV